MKLVSKHNKKQTANQLSAAKICDEVVEALNLRLKVRRVSHDTNDSSEEVQVKC